MTGVKPSLEGYIVDAVLLGHAFGVDPAAVPELMRSSKIAGHHEEGRGADAGRHCLVFSYSGRTFRVILDSAGNILSTAVFRTILNLVRK